MEEKCNLYAGEAGARRIELLEELAREVAHWGDRPRWAGNWPQLNRIVAAIGRDNERLKTAPGPLGKEE